MENLARLSDGELLSQLKNLVVEERKMTVTVLHFLKEVEARRLYAYRAYSSLHEFCVEELGYSEGSAYRRIQAMRLLRDLPEVEEKILSGELNVCVLSQVQNFVKHEKKEGKPVSKERKAELVQSFCGKSLRDVQKELVKLSPNLGYQEKIRAVSENQTAIHLLADTEFMELLEKVKQLSGIPGEKVSDLLKKAMRSYIGKKTIVKKTPALEEKPMGASRFRTKATEIEVRTRDDHRCTYVDELTGRRCSAAAALHFDHKTDFAKDGPTIPKNLQLLCHAHNQLKAIKEYGKEKMGKYLKMN